MRPRGRQPSSQGRRGTLTLALLAASAVVAACFDFDGYRARNLGASGTGSGGSAGGRSEAGIDVVAERNADWDGDSDGAAGTGGMSTEPTDDSTAESDAKEPSASETSLDQDAEAGVDADGEAGVDVVDGEAGADVDAGCIIQVDGGVCRTFPQCGCPPGSGCDFQVNDDYQSTVCVQNGLSVQRGQRCHPLQCAPGLTCYRDACKHFCERAVDCPTPGAGCVQVLQRVDGGYEAILFDWVCTDQCALDHPEERCGSGLGCVPDDDVWIKPGHSSCAKVSKAEDTCDDGICAPGYTCLQDGKCHRWCRPGPNADCPQLRSCKKLPNPKSGVTGFYFVGEQEFGVCM